MVEEAPRVVLTNGLRVSGFSSVHPFTFVDGAVLQGCTVERAQALRIDSKESESPGIRGTTDIALKWVMTENVLAELRRLDCLEDIDIVLIPLPLISALKDGGHWPSFAKLRGHRLADSVSKVCHIDRFCI